MVWCTWVGVGPTSSYTPYLAVSRDAGRSWTQAQAKGLVYNAQGDEISPVMPSPRYTHDRTACVATGDGLQETTDFGAKLTMVDPLTGSSAVPVNDPVARPASDLSALTASGRPGLIRLRQRLYGPNRCGAQAAPASGRR